MVRLAKIHNKVNGTYIILSVRKPRSVKMDFKKGDSNGKDLKYKMGGSRESNENILGSMRSDR